MAVKIIATDLDGTLMAPDHLTVTERNKKALADAHESGIKFCIATGRPLSLVKRVTNQVPFADYVICANGASVYDRNNGKFVYSNLVSPEITAQAIELFRTLPLFYNIYADGIIYVQKGTDIYFRNAGIPDDFLQEFVSNIVYCDDISSQMKDKGSELIDVFYTNEETKKTVYEFFGSKGLVLTSALDGVVSVTAKGADKGTALKGLCDIMGFTSDEAMAFGDASNDSTMLEYAGFSFAMENGDDKCKASAKFSAPSNAEDGVAQIIEKYALR